MINKYAEIQDKILLYNACKGILRVKRAYTYNGYSYTPNYSQPPVYNNTRSNGGIVSRSSQFSIPGVESTPYYNGPNRNAAAIRQANSAMTNQFKTNGFTWDKSKGAYNWTGPGSGYTASQVELARLRNIWNNMNDAERQRYQSKYNQHVQALQAYDPRRRFTPRARM